MPETKWLLYAENVPAPLCRKPGGSYMAEDDNRPLVCAIHIEIEVVFGIEIPSHETVRAHSCLRSEAVSPGDDLVGVAFRQIVVIRSRDYEKLVSEVSIKRDVRRGCSECGYI
ncbi:hypothetical protein MJS38_34465, partial [Burkholderia gladioli]